MNVNNDRFAFIKYLRFNFFCVSQTVQQRGAAVIKARKLSSAMSAAKAIRDHMRDIWTGTPEVRFVACFKSGCKVI